MKPLAIWLWENTIWRPRAGRLRCSDCQHWRSEGMQVNCALTGRSVGRERRHKGGWWASWRARECGYLGRWHTTAAGYNLECERMSLTAYWLSFLGLPLAWVRDPWWVLAVGIDWQIALMAFAVWCHPICHRGERP